MVQTIQKHHRSFSAYNMRVRIGAGTLAIILLGEAAFAYGSRLV